MKFSFDGGGVNDANDPYCPRIATLTRNQLADPDMYQKAGRLMAAAPALAAALAQALPWLILLGDYIGNGTQANPMGRCDAILAARDALDGAGIPYNLEIERKVASGDGSEFPAA